MSEIVQIQFKEAINVVSIQKIKDIARFDHIEYDKTSEAGQGMVIFYICIIWGSRLTIFDS